MTPPEQSDVLERRTPDAATARLSAELDDWLRVEPHPTLGRLVAAFGRKSFAIVFVLLLGVPALGVVLVSLGVVLEDIAVVALGVTAGAAGVALEIVLARAVLHGLGAVLSACRACGWSDATPRGGARPCTDDDERCHVRDQRPLTGARYAMPPRH